eukprot:tig00000480_g1335.t1
MPPPPAYPQQKLEDLVPCTFQFSSFADAAVFRTYSPDMDSPLVHMKRAIDSVVGRPQYAKARWGIHAADVKTGKTLYGHNMRLALIPASNVKIFTAAAALEKLGPEYRHKTPVHGTGLSPPVLEELRVSARGDPMITTAHVSELADSLRTQGVRTVRSLVIDDSRIKTPITWEASQLQSANAGGMLLNGSAANLIVRPTEPGQLVRFSWLDAVNKPKVPVVNEALTVGAGEPERPVMAFIDVAGSLVIRGAIPAHSDERNVTVALPDARARFARMLHKVLEDAKIRVGKVMFTAPAVGLSPSFKPWTLDFIARPLSALVNRVLQWSDNLWAEALLHTLGSDTQRTYPAFVMPLALPAPDRSIQRGLMAMKEVAVRRYGADPSGVLLVDGSGLSRRNAASPEALTQTLRGIALHSPHRRIFFESLPLAGRSGTLRSRMRGTSAAAVLRGKTGTLMGVSALSGYVHGMAYSVIVNHGLESSVELRKPIDEICVQLARYPLLSSPLDELDWS